MSWGKLDDRYDDNRKIKRAARRDLGSIGLHVMAITYSCRHELDGHVDSEWLSDISTRIGHDVIERAIKVLVDEGLFEPDRDGDGFWVHDFLDFNASRESRQALRDKAAAAKRAARTGGRGK